VTENQQKIMPVVSFCIPTYNRDEKAYSLVNKILSHPGDNIEVIVADNLSTDKTKQLLSNITDKRFNFFENETNIGGKNNCLKALSLGAGEYVCLCLDKDNIDYLFIEEMISFFCSNPEVVVGYCSLNNEKISNPVLYEKGIDSIKNMAYLSKHPSGNFYKNEYLKELNIYDKRGFYNSETGFMFEFINAEMCIYGKSAVLNIPLFSTETKNEASKNKSHSYDANSVYFLPSKQYDLYQLYLNHIYTLKVKKEEMKALFCQLFTSKLESATIGFNLICNDMLICQHYSFVPPKNATISFLFNDLFFCRKFIFSCKHETIFLRIYLCIKANFFICAKIFKNKLNSVFSIL
jgi:glycosyltransferase involved in cell wall biosynthesis